VTIQYVLLGIMGAITFAGIFVGLNIRDLKQQWDKSATLLLQNLQQTGDYHRYEEEEGLDEMLETGVYRPSVDDVERYYQERSEADTEALFDPYNDRAMQRVLHGE
jgi:hypothetical protein